MYISLFLPFFLHIYRPITIIATLLHVSVFRFFRAALPAGIHSPIAMGSLRLHLFFAVGVAVEQPSRVTAQILDQRRYVRADVSSIGLIEVQRFGRDAFRTGRAEVVETVFEVVLVIVYSGYCIGQVAAVPKRIGVGNDLVLSVRS